MRFIQFIEGVIFKYYLISIIFVLLIFKREIPIGIKEELKKMIEEVKTTPITPKDERQ